MRPLHAHIHLAALRHNLRVLKSLSGAAQCFVVVKADAYGHGLPLCYPAWAEADGFFVLELEQALWLKQQDAQRPVGLIEGVFEPQELEPALAAGLELVIHQPQQALWLERWRGRVPLKLWLKLNLGMNRLGLAPQVAEELWRQLKAWPQTTVSLMAHFAKADEPDGTAAQLERVSQLSWAAGQRWSLANSAALLSAPASHAAVVRAGLASYGISPIGGRLGSDWGLKPAMSLMSQIIAIQQLKAGDQVGYGGLFTAAQPMRVGMVACGYADGYPQHVLSAPAAVCGISTTTVGRVSMDMLAVDLSAIPEATLGSPVQLWGESVPVESVAAAAGVNPYSLVSGLTWRVPKQVVG